MRFHHSFRGAIAGAALLGLSALAGAGQSTDIVGTAKAAGSFNTLVVAIEAAGLTQTLQGTGPFTVFAPTDEAFAKLPPGTVDALLKDKAKLARILTYHVVAGEVMAKDVKPGKVTTVEGEKINVTRGSAGVKVNNANVIKTDVVASNGVIHVIDTVLIPN
jgi:uncharacterized surface protein with fasciclin (FAS1) repeats